MFVSGKVPGAISFRVKAMTQQNGFIQERVGTACDIQGQVDVQLSKPRSALQYKV